MKRDAQMDSVFYGEHPEDYWQEQQRQQADTALKIAREDQVIASANSKHPLPYFEDGFWRICAWCDPGWKSPDGAPVSHGICQRHAQLLTATLQNPATNNNETEALCNRPETKPGQRGATGPIPQSALPPGLGHATRAVARITVDTISNL